MAGYNRVILVGNLTRDPQLSYTPSNTAVAEFGLASSHRWRGQDGQDHEETCFVDCSVFGRQAEVFCQYMSKGRQVLVEGRLKFRQWETPEGQKRSKLSVTVEKFQFLGQGRPEGAARPEGPQGRPMGQPQARQTRPPVTSAPARAAAAESMPPMEEDMPAPVDEGDVPPPMTDKDVPF